jgi:hypothetical protein
MKKLLSFILIAMLVFSCTAALAETAATADAPADAAFEGSWVQFEDGFEIYLPNEWLVVDPTDEMLKSGVFYAVTSPDGARNMQVAWSEEAGATDANAVKTQLEATYTEVQVLNLNGIDFVTYVDEANDSTGIVALGTKGDMFVFNFYPASDEAYAPIAVTIATSIRNTAA